jgi:hypothetical protein
MCGWIYFCLQDPQERISPEERIKAKDLNSFLSPGSNLERIEGEEVA